MRKIIEISRVAAAGLLAAQLFAFGGIVFAHEDDHHVQSEQTTVAQETQDTAEKTVEQKKQELLERLSKRKADLQTKLTASAKTRLQSRCKNSQGSLSALGGRIHGLETSRNEKYSNLHDRLTKLSTKLKNAGLDTTTLDSQIVVLDEKIADFKTDLADYKQAVADLAEMDCATDPDAFKASLEEARSLRAGLRQNEADIKTYMKETLKPTLVQLREQLATKNGEGEN